MGVQEVPEGGLGTPYIGRAGRFLGLETRPQAALLEAQWDVRGSPLLYIEDLLASSIAHFMEVSPLVRPAILQPSPVA